LPLKRSAASPAPATPPPGTALGRGWTLSLLLPFALVLGAVILIPVAQLLWQSLGKGWSGYSYLLESPLRLRVLGRTLRDCATTTVGCLLVGFILAWSIRSTQRRWLRTLLSAAIFLPMWMNVTLKNYAWMIILGQGGVLQSSLAAFGFAGGSVLFTSTAVVIGLVYTLFPFAALPLLVALRGIPDSLLQAAASLGAGPAAVLSSVVLPQIAASACTTAILVYILAMGFYVTPLILGGPHSTFVASLIQDDMFRRFDRVAATALSMVLVVLSLLFIVVGSAVLGRARFAQTMG
jgi:ABC-type spermidine/putrescine transport system permease subunit I